MFVVEAVYNNIRHTSIMFECHFNTMVMLISQLNLLDKVSNDFPCTLSGQGLTDRDTRTTASPRTSPSPRCLGQTLELPVSRGLVKDKILQGHVIWTQTVLSELQCEDSCLRLPSCLAYNYNCSGGVGPKKCELLNSVTDTTNFTGFFFRPFERTKARNVSKRHPSISTV